MALDQSALLEVLEALKVAEVVCPKHGGAAPQVKAAAHQRVIEAQLRAGFAVSWARYREQAMEFESERVRVTAELLKMSPEDVKPIDIWYCRTQYGRPAPDSARPEITYDRRFGPRRAS